jgi:hypothetical protein
MKKINKVKIVIPILLVASGFTLAACGNSGPSYSKSYKAGVAWVRNDFPGSDQTICLFSVLAQGINCNQANNVCDSNAAVLAMSSNNYNMQQWINGCVSVPFKHYPQWYRNLVFGNN